MQARHLSYKESVRQQKAPLFGSVLKVHATVRYVVNLFVYRSDMMIVKQLTHLIHQFRIATLLSSRKLPRMLAMMSIHLYYGSHGPVRSGSEAIFSGP